MKDIIFIFRAGSLPAIKLTPKGALDISKKWENWMGGIVAQNKLLSAGNRLGNDAMTVKAGNIVTSGPYAEIKEFVGGSSAIQGESVIAAAERTKTCPILAFGGNVETRDIIPMN